MSQETTKRTLAAITHERYFILLALFFGYLLLNVLLPRALGVLVFLCVVIVAAWLADGCRRTRRILVVVLLAPVMGLIAIELLSGTDSDWGSFINGPAGVVLKALLLAFLIYCGYALLRSLVRAHRITRNEILGSINIYFILGYSWGIAYSILETCVPGSFNLGDTERLRTPIFFYFSFITLATQGYGDITPQNAAARNLVIAETIIGQFYLALLVAYLLSIHITQRLGAPSTSGDT